MTSHPQLKEPFSFVNVNAHYTIPMPHEEFTITLNFL